LSAWLFTRGKENTMTTPPTGNPFGAFMPGWDFLQNLGKAQSEAASPMAGWVAPTLNVEDLDKRIQELKAVQYWLEQNTRMLGATIQALEVQKMTLSTLKSMNVQADALAQSLKLKPEDFMEKWRKPAASQAASSAAASEPASQPLAAEEPFDEPPAAPDQPEVAGVDPVQWWGALSQQFQDIASTAAKDWQHHAEKAKANIEAATQVSSPPQAKVSKTRTKPVAKKAVTTKSAAKKVSSTARRAKPGVR
jgi:hypothetical protein